MSASTRLTGLVTAVHTPFDEAGELRLAVIEKQAEHLLKNGVRTVFIGGSTGESHSLALTERQELAERWSAVARATSLKVVVHVGSNCLADARRWLRKRSGSRPRRSRPWRPVTSSPGGWTTSSVGVRQSPPQPPECRSISMTSRL